MPVIPLELPKASNPGRYGADGSVRLVNCYTESAGEAKTPFPLYATDGLAAFATLPDGGACRGMLAVGPSLYVVSGRLLYRVDISGTVTVLGGIPGDGRVYMSQNRKAPTPQVAAVSEGLRFIITGNTITPITDSDLPPPNSVEFLDGYFVFTVADGRFAWSSIDEGTEIDALDFATAEANPDGLLRGITKRRELWLFGERTIEVWYTPPSDTTITFERLGGAVIERGCLSGASVAKIEEVLIWVSDDCTVRVTDGYDGRRISTHAVERAIASAAASGQISAFAYSKDGHSYYVLSGPAFTWVCDLTLMAKLGPDRAWHERQSYGLDRWRAQGYAFFQGKHIVGDHEAGALYEIDAGAYDEAGDPLVMVFRVPIHAYPQRIQLNRIHFDMVPGVGQNSSDTDLADPQFMLRTSRDGGKSWGEERSRSLGTIGNYAREVEFSRCGSSKEDGFVIEGRVSSAVIRAITGAAVDVVKLKA